MNPAQAHKITLEYDDRTVRQFMGASILLGAVDMLVGVIIASQLTTWQMNGKFIESLSFMSATGVC